MLKERKSTKKGNKNVNNWTIVVVFGTNTVVSAFEYLYKQVNMLKKLVSKKCEGKNKRSMDGKCNIHDIWVR